AIPGKEFIRKISRKTDRRSRIRKLIRCDQASAIGQFLRIWQTCIERKACGILITDRKAVIPIPRTDSYQLSMTQSGQDQKRSKRQKKLPRQASFREQC